MYLLGTIELKMHKKINQNKAAFRRISKVSFKMKFEPKLSFLRENHNND